MTGPEHQTRAAEPTQTHAPARPAGGASPAWLLASAVVLAGLLVAQLGRVNSGVGSDALAAYLGPGVLRGDYGAAVLPVSNAEDVLLVLDQRGEGLLIYDVFNQGQLRFSGREDLRAMFVRGRREAGQ
jgi:hypothetical protein